MRKVGDELAEKESAGTGMGDELTGEERKVEDEVAREERNTEDELAGRKEKWRINWQGKSCYVKRG